MNQEQDQGYQEYQPAVKASTQRVMNVKFGACVLARKKARQKAEGALTTKDDMPPLANLGNLDVLLDLVDDEDKEDGAAQDGEKGFSDNVIVPDQLKYDKLVAEQDALVK